LESKISPPLYIAVLGGGHWGPHLIRNFHDGPETSVKWIVEPRVDRQEALASRFRDIEIVADSSAAFLDPVVDAVVIATPTATHGDLVRSALEAGKHVLVEKPLTNSSKVARVLCEYAQERALVLMVGHVFLFNPAVTAAKDLLAKGELGDIYYASMVRTNLGPVRTDVDAAWDLASHDVAIANYWLDSTPTSVSCRGGSWLNSGIDDAVFATLEYPGGILVHIHASWLHPRKARDMVLVGSRRMLSVNDMDLTEPLRVYDKGVEDRSQALVQDTLLLFGPAFVMGRS
jgi:predicted dehydrogenase